MSKDYRMMVQEAVEAVKGGGKTEAREASLNIAVHLLDSLYQGGNTPGTGGASQWLDKVTEGIEENIKSTMSS